MRGVSDPFSVPLLDGKLDAAEAAIAEKEISADADKFHMLDAVHCSYIGVGGVTGTLEVYFGGIVKWTILLYLQDDWEFSWPKGLYTATKNEAMKVSLTSVANYTGKLSFSYRTVGSIPEGIAKELNKTAMVAAGSPAQNSAAADAEHAWCLDSIHCAYADTPVNGGLTVAFGGTTEFQVDIADKTPHEFAFPGGLYTGTKNQALLITMADGSQVKHLNCTYR